MFPDGCTDTTLNDWLWFDRDSIYEYLGIDSNGNDIGSTEWARPILMDYAREKEPEVCQFGNIYYIIACFLEEEYEDGDCDSDDDLKDEFDRYVHEQWVAFAAQQLKAWHSDVKLEAITDWLEENYDYSYGVPDLDEVVDDFKEYADSLSEEDLEEDE